MTRLASTHAVVAAALLFGLSGCGSDSGGDDLPLPVPDTFRAYFVAGTVCMPTNIASSSGGEGTAPGYPVRFDVCTHRCITLDRATARIEQSFLCAAGQCSMVMLASAQATRVQSETNCDGRELPSPPPGECRLETFTFSDIDPPFLSSGSYVQGNVQVAVPFMNLDQAEQVQNRVAAGENATQVINEVVGPPAPARQWMVNLDPGHAAVSDGASLAGADCHAIPAP